MSKATIVLSEFFSPNIGATSQLISGLYSHLTSKAVNTTVLTSTADTHSKDQNIVRLKSPISISSGILSKASKGLSFLLRSFFWLLIHARKNDTILIVSNPPFIVLIGVVLKVLKGIRYLYLFQDVFPRSAVLSGILPSRGPITGLWNLLMRISLEQSYATIVLNDRMAHRCTLDFGPNIPLHIIPNWSVHSCIPLLKAESKYTHNWDLSAYLTIQYSGNLGELHDIITLLEASRLLQDLPVKFVFIGDGAKAKQVYAYKKSFSLSNIHHYPYQPINELNQSIASSDLSVVSQIPSSADTVAPCKFYGIISCARPVLYIGSPTSDLSQFIQHHQCGYVVESGDVLGLVSLIHTIYAEPSLLVTAGQNAFNAYHQHYSKSHSCDLYLRLLNS